MKFQNLYTLLSLSVTILLPGCSFGTTEKITNTPSVIPSIAVNTVASPIVFVSGGDIYTISETGDDLQNLTSGISKDSDPSWSPDGHEITFSSAVNGDSQIYIMNADGANRKQLTHDRARAWGSVWSTDGENIIFNTERDNVLSGNRKIPVSEMYIMKRDGTDQRRLTFNQDFERSFSWSPKGDVIALSANVQTAYGYDSTWLYLMNPDGVISKTPIVLGNIDRPSWSPDGRFIVFASTDFGDSGIYIVEPDGSNKICVIKSTSPVFVMFPSWSPDGNYIVFSSNRDGDYDLYTVKVDGSELTQITNLPGDEMSPAWSPMP